MRNFRSLVLGLVLVSLAGVSWGASSGTGFFVSPQGHIVSNEHVVEGCSAIDFSFGGQKHSALVLAVDKTNDIALLQTTFDNSKFLSFAPRDPELLDPIIVAGYPFGDSLSSTIKVTRGVVSSLAGIDNNFSNVQIDAAIQPGNSGGPIVNDQGQVLAIAVSKLDAEYALKTFGSLPESVNFGIKGGLVKSFLVANNVAVTQSPLADKKLGQLLTETTVKLNCASKTSVANNKSTGELNPPEPHSNEQIGSTFGMFVVNAPQVLEGVLVTHSGLEGYSAGIRKGDIILRAGGKPIENAADFAQVAGQAQLGDLIPILLISKKTGRRTYATVEVLYQ
jgi:S1-C subfamily serine protease